ncbi:unnamed protein product [Lepeophtheirus salmonis]|uniref:(salmon louse) hypothetical protein n=1 Tax=Lepeophtheirus salmonis TaxID=72036 RepID=A0A7R8GYR2_LEPSM|nr:unnamed protein product [Lepeophtheirus salmonis]CAF2751133.1 unnamed protein product [Lepeophtheirus salmonis]
MEKKIELRLLEFGHDGKYAVKWKCLPSLFKVPYNDEENLFLDYVSGVMDLQSTVNTWNFRQEIENEEDMNGFPDIPEADPSENEEIQVADKSEEFRDVPTNYDEEKPSEHRMEQREFGNPNLKKFPWILIDLHNIMSQNVKIYEILNIMYIHDSQGF